MAELPPSIVLGSASPRRRELLENIGLVFRVAPADIDESVRPGEDARRYVHRLAIEKAIAVVASPDDLVIAADTTVDVDGAILGKPTDDSDARRILGLLSGRSHYVHTGVAVRCGDHVEAGVVTTHVTMVNMSPAMLDWYIGTGEPMGKAGAYAMQGAAALLVEGLQGSVSNVIGLPLTLLESLVVRHGHSLPALAHARRR